MGPIIISFWCMDDIWVMAWRICTFYFYACITYGQWYDIDLYIDDTLAIIQYGYMFMRPITISLLFMINTWVMMCHVCNMFCCMDGTWTIAWHGYKFMGLITISFLCMNGTWIMSWHICKFYFCTWNICSINVSLWDLSPFIFCTWMTHG